MCSCRRRHVHLYCISLFKLVFSSNWTTLYILMKSPRLLTQIINLRYLKARLGGKYYFGILSSHALKTIRSLSNTPFSSLGQRFVARKSMLFPILEALKPILSISIGWIFESYTKNFIMLACHFLISSF